MKALIKKLKELETSDYQNREGKYPVDGIPDSIKLIENDDGVQLEFDFKNTNEQEAQDWYDSSKEFLIVNKLKNTYFIVVNSHQDGDYADDWMKLIVKLIKKVPAATTRKTRVKVIKTKVTESEKIEIEYTYVLSNPTQSKEINLIKYKKELELIVKNYLLEKLISITVDKRSYTLTLNSHLKVGEKRRLGRLISQNTDLKNYVKKISYNNSKDISGQLFILKNKTKEDKNETSK